MIDTRYEPGSIFDRLSQAADQASQAASEARDNILRERQKLKALKVSAGTIRPEDLWGRHYEAANLPEAICQRSSRFQMILRTGSNT
jgi:hypothetical protein